MTLEDALDNIIRKDSRASNRLDSLADYAIEQLAHHGLPGARGGSSGELPITGLARSKNWDLAYDFAGKPRLLISLKSIWSNAGGTVPNRIDDLMGETANIQQMSPEIVVGYILLFDAKADTVRQKDGLSWSQHFENVVKRIAIRKAPLWNQGLLEGTWFVKFDSRKSKGSRLTDPSKAEKEGRAFFTSLLHELKVREPAVPFSEDIPLDRDTAQTMLTPPHPRDT